MTWFSPVGDRGFTLTEIAIALGLAAFCMVAVMGLLPAGIHSNRASLEQTQAAALAAAVEDDLRSLARVTNEPAYSPRFRFLRKSSAPMQTVFIAEDGSPASPPEARYRVTVRGPQKPAGSLRGPSAAGVIVTWPAVADSQPGNWPTNAQGRLETLVMIPSP